MKLGLRHKDHNWQTLQHYANFVGAFNKGEALVRAFSVIVKISRTFVSSSGSQAVGLEIFVLECGGVEDVFLLFLLKETAPAAKKRGVLVYYAPSF